MQETTIERVNRLEKEIIRINVQIEQRNKRIVEVQKRMAELEVTLREHGLTDADLNDIQAFIDRKESELATLLTSQEAEILKAKQALEGSVII